MTYWQFAKLESWHWGVVIYNRIVTWTAFAILAMFKVRTDYHAVCPKWYRFYSPSLSALLYWICDGGVDGLLDTQHSLVHSCSHLGGWSDWSWHLLLAGCDWKRGRGWLGSWMGSILSLWSTWHHGQHGHHSHHDHHSQYDYHGLHDESLPLL